MVDKGIYDKIIVIGEIVYVLPTSPYTNTSTTIWEEEVSKINHDIDGYHDNIDKTLYKHHIPQYSSLTATTSRDGVGDHE